ncbi:MAG: sugar phosphate isomerase/epimerase, partial [Actinomycetota bacterium]|nr:sugar phosphate isomerase/epimerase [Actinomycetota bacterium]
MAIGAAKAKGAHASGAAGLSGRLGLTVPHEWWPSAHVLKSYEAAGFAHVQIDAPPVSVLFDSRLITRHAGATRTALDTTTLGCVIHAPPGVRLGTAAGDRAMDGLIEYAAEVGAAQVVYHALAIADEPHTRDACRYEEISLRRAAMRCGRLGQTLAIENLAPLYPGAETISATPANLRAVVRRVGSAALGLCLDLGHAHVIAERRHTSLMRLIEPVLDVVTLFHAHDNFGARLGGQNGR